MNRQEHLITILGEECSELHQELCKALRFGVYEQRDLSTSNAERIFKEFNDLIAMVEMVNESAIATSFKDARVTLGERGLMYRDESLIRAKKEKVEKYLLYSKTRGTLVDTDYKEGLLLAKKFIDVHVGDPDMSDGMIEAHRNYVTFIEHYNLEDL